MTQYDHARACVDLGERLTELGNDLSGPHICDRVTIHADNAAMTALTTAIKTRRLYRRQATM